MSEKKFITSIFYFVPEDGEDGSEMNAFPVYKKIEDVRLTDIKEGFPLPGDYHFRFQHLFNHKMLVWLDLNNEGWQLPQVENQIIVKALRLSWKTKHTSFKLNDETPIFEKQTRSSEPEEHKDLNDLLGIHEGGKDDNGKGGVTRHSHPVQPKQHASKQDPYGDIDFGIF